MPDDGKDGTVVDVIAPERSDPPEQVRRAEFVVSVGGAVGASVLVYQLEGEPPRCSISFFEGYYIAADVSELRNVLTKALERMSEWNLDPNA